MTRGRSFGKVNKIDKPLIQINQKKRENDTQISKIRKERGRKFKTKKKKDYDFLPV